MEHVLFDPDDSGVANIYYTFNGLSFRCMHINIGDKEYSTYKESIEINNKTYKDVLFLYSPRGGSLSNKAYINQSFGLFHFIAKENNPIYTLQTH